MVAALRRVARRVHAANPGVGYVSITEDGYNEWLHNDFKKRHTDIYSRWMKGQHVLPMSKSQYYRYVKQNADFESDLIKSIPALKADGGDGLLDCNGPGEVYELDATYGQVVLLPAGAPLARFFLPCIYLLIDRWSRYIVSVFASLRPASWEVLRILLRIAFTSRERRFQHLGFPISDKEWPPGVVPIRIVTDRGSDMISEEMLEATVEGMRINVKILPPLCPDGKAIIEKAIGDLKRRLKRDSDLRGQYDKFTKDIQKKDSKLRAIATASSSLAPLYRAVLDKVDDHNNRIHATLAKRSILKTNGIAPTPREAYLFGLDFITGIQRPPLDDEDYRRLTLVTESARLNDNGNMTFRSRTYRPANAAALRYCNSNDAGPVRVKVDTSDPFELFIPSKSEHWPQWNIDKAGARDLNDITLEEQVALADLYRLAAAKARDEEERGRPKRGAAGSRSRAPTASPGVKESPGVVHARRRAESDGLVRTMEGAPSRRGSDHSSGEEARSQRDRFEEDEEARIIAANRDRRRRQ